MRKRVLLDTDIGSDIDDAICLAYLLAQPECELLGITTVTGEAYKRAMLASALCRVADKQIPIYPGIEKPIKIPQKQSQAPQAESLAKWDHDTEFPAGEAIEFMRRTIRAFPGEIILLAIGPATNIATLFKVDPQIPSLLNSLVLMCGVFAQGRDFPYPQEWNASVDPHAASLVYGARVNIHRSIGLDATMQLTMEADSIRERFKSPLLRPLLDFAEVWFRKYGEITFHDPLAAATIFDEAICQFEKGTVEVDTVNDSMLGTTNFRPGGPDAPHEVALGVDRERFFNHLFNVLEA